MWLAGSERYRVNRSLAVHPVSPAGWRGRCRAENESPFTTDITHQEERDDAMDAFPSIPSSAARLRSMRRARIKEVFKYSDVQRPTPLASFCSGIPGIEIDGRMSFFFSTEQQLHFHSNSEVVGWQ